MTVSEMCQSCRLPSEEAAREARRRWDSIAKPLHGLGLLEDAIVKICSITGGADCSLTPRAVAVFCADNGVVAQGVTQTGQEVTAIVAENMTRGETSVCRMAALAGAEVIPVDMGMARRPACPGILDRRQGDGCWPQARWASATPPPAAPWPRSSWGRTQRPSPGGGRGFPARA